MKEMHIILSNLRLKLSLYSIKITIMQFQIINASIFADLNCMLTLWKNITNVMT